MLKMTKKYGKSVDIGQSAYYDTGMEQVPQNKTPKWKRQDVERTKSGW